MVLSVFIVMKTPEIMPPIMDAIDCDMTLPRKLSPWPDSILFLRASRRGSLVLGRDDVILTEGARLVEGRAGR